LVKKGKNIIIEEVIILGEGFCHKGNSIEKEKTAVKQEFNTSCIEKASKVTS